jgi:purine-binding chemotaxis protein CheW
VDDESFEPPPETTQGTARELILGAYKLPDQLLLLLDLKKTLDIGTEVHA